MKFYNGLHIISRVRRPRFFCSNTLLKDSILRSQGKKQVSNVLLGCPDLEVFSLGSDKSRATSNAWRHELVSNLLIFIILDVSFLLRKAGYLRHHWMVWWQLGEKLPSNPVNNTYFSAFLFLSFSQTSSQEERIWHFKSSYELTSRKEVIILGGLKYF